MKKPGVAVVPGQIILTACQGKNEDLFPNILRLYVPDGSMVADVTWGKGNFWKQVDISKYVLYATDITTGTDVRKLPYEDGSIDALVLDPLYIVNSKNTVKDSISSSYNVNQSEGFCTVYDVLAFYKDAMNEARRVLKNTGVLIVKCQDQNVSSRQCWIHVEIQMMGEKLGFFLDDLFVLMQNTQPASRWPTQYHARKNHSYFLVFSRNSRCRYPLTDGADDCDESIGSWR